MIGTIPSLRASPKFTYINNNSNNYNPNHNPNNNNTIHILCTPDYNDNISYTLAISEWCSFFTGLGVILSSYGYSQYYKHPSIPINLKNVNVLLNITGITEDDGRRVMDGIGGGVSTNISFYFF
jgi:hypothetical protein